MIKEIVTKWIDEVQKDVLKHYDNAGIKASGNFGKQLKPFYSEKNQTITSGLIGAHYSYWLENGRKPTSPSKRGKLYGVMLKWVKDKRIATQIQDQKRIAYFVAKKIDEEGYNGKQIISKVVTDKRIEQLNEQIGKLYSAQITDSIWQLQQ